MLLHASLLAAVNPWPGTVVACIALCAIFGWPRFGSVNKGLFGAKQLKAFSADLASIKSDLADLKHAVAELDRVLKSVE